MFKVKCKVNEKLIKKKESNVGQNEFTLDYTDSYDKQSLW